MLAYLGVKMSDSPPRYPPLHEPEFHSTIPPHLLSKLSENEQHQVHTMSRLEAHLTWLSTVLHTHHGAIAGFDAKFTETDAILNRVTVTAGAAERQLGEMAPKLEKLIDYRNTLEAQGTPAKVQALWDWRSNFTGKIGIIFVAGAAILSVVLKFVADTVVRYFSTKP